MRRLWTYFIVGSIMTAGSTAFAGGLPASDNAAATAGSTAQSTTAETTAASGSASTGSAAATAHTTMAEPSRDAAPRGAVYEKHPLKKLLTGNTEIPK